MIGLRSNWDWDLDRHLVANGIVDEFDLVVCSAVVGYRKPHPAIFECVRDACGQVADILFVGDTLAGRRLRGSDSWICADSSGAR